MTQRRLPTVLFALALLTTGLAGCIGTDEPLTDQDLGEPTPKDAYDTARGWSQPLEPARFDVLPGVKAFVESVDGTELAVGLFLPDIPGCDWDASALNDSCQVPVVMDAGPYYLDTVDRDKFRPPIIEWLVPRGYAVVQMSLRGTGESGGCYQFKNPQDVEDVGAVVDHLANQPWSNGNVAMIGRSYDGTAAWSGAASGHPALKTIVPISGAVDGPLLYYKNGTSETRGYVQPAGYWLYAYGLVAGDPTYRTPDYVNTLCSEALEDWVRGPRAAATGDAGTDYWQSRDLTDRIVEDYQGSVWVIHGLEDWNVNPSQAIPFSSEMAEAGIPVRGWFGQWAHAYPDRIDEHRNVRWDWAQQVLEWFDFHLKGEGDQPWLGVEVEDSLYVWRKEATYPPADANWTGFEFHGEAVAAERPWSFTTDPLEQDLRIAGLPRLHLEAIPTTATGGHLFAELFDVFPDGRTVRLGWAAMNLQYYQGGNTDPQTLTPGEPVVARMQFEPMDAHVGQGHQLRLVVHKDGVEDVMPSPDPSVVLLGQSTLSLPVIERPDAVSTTAVGPGDANGAAVGPGEPAGTTKG